MAYVTVTCPTCHQGRTETHCDHCGNLIADQDVSTVAVMVSQPDAPSPRYLCVACKVLPLPMASLGA